MNPERRGHEEAAEGAKMVGASVLEMVGWEKNRQKHNPESGAALEHKLAVPEQEDIRDIYRRHKSALHRLKRAVGLE